MRCTVAAAAVAPLAMAILSATPASSFSTGPLGFAAPSALRSPLGAPSASTRTRSARRMGGSLGLRAHLDPSTIHHASEVLQHDWATLFASADPSHLNWNLLADAAADAIDPASIGSDSSGSGMGKPLFGDFEFPKLPLPQFPDVWGGWMGLLKGTIVKLAEVTGSYGTAIIFIVAIVKAITYPLNYQVYAAQAEMATLQPELDRIKEEYKDNQDLINMRTSQLYQNAEVNPLAGCLPVLIQFPIFIGLYRTLVNLGKDSSFSEGFLFIPSLAGPVQAGLPTDYDGGLREDAPWLLQNWVDGVPPLGWHDTLAYCAVPVMVVIAQLVSNAYTKATAPPKKPEEQQGDGSLETLLAVFPFLIGWFALNLPAGCALYWLVNTVSTFGIQVYIKSLFKKPEPAMAGAGGGGGASGKEDQENVIVKGLKTVVDTADGILGAGLPDTEELRRQNQGPPPEVDGVKEGPKPWESDFWLVPEKKSPQSLALKETELDDLAAKAKAAREARKAAKAAKDAAKEA